MDLSFSLPVGTKFFVYCVECDRFLYISKKEGYIYRAVARDRSLTHQDLMGHIPVLFDTHTQGVERIAYAKGR
jgi:hypothetical protein